MRHNNRIYREPDLDLSRLGSRPVPWWAPLASRALTITLTTILFATLGVLWWLLISH